jgi:hypothetical protein
MGVDQSVADNAGLSVPDRVSIAERELLDLYAGRAAVFERAVARADRVSLLISYARGVSVATATSALLAVYWWPGPPRALLWTAVLVAALAFLALVVAHARVDARKRWNQMRGRQNREQAARVRRDWNSVPRADLGQPPPDHPFADDLDLIGRASLADLLGAPATPAGRRLLTPATTEAIRRRQEGVAELAAELEWRQQVHAFGVQAAFDPARLERFVAWAEESPWLLRRRALVWTSRLLPAVAASLAALHYFGVTDGAYWLPVLLANTVVWYTAGRRLHKTFDRVEVLQPARDHSERLFRVVREHAFRSGSLTGLASTLGSGHAAADGAFRRLGRLMSFVDLRYSSLLHFPVNAATLWDLHVLYALERWREVSGGSVRRWFDTVGEFEALSALAGLSHDNPDWTYPEPATAMPPVLEARELAHPLLPRGVRVANDVSVGPAGRFLFITGSNMSGKSTLLRALGVNVVLSEAGGPVCASLLRLPRVELRTMMRVQDSLELGVSYFMASLNRLRRVIAPAATGRADQSVLLYLLDEILQGTNTAERQIAVRTIVRHLLARPAIGALTSHDLSIAEVDDIRAAADAVHFTEGLDGAADTARLSFDYRLRPGVATSRNALKLMRLIGLAADDLPARDQRDDAR